MNVEGRGVIFLPFDAFHASGSRGSLQAIRASKKVRWIVKRAWCSRGAWPWGAPFMKSGSLSMTSNNTDQHFVLVNVRGSPLNVGARPLMNVIGRAGSPRERSPMPHSHALITIESPHYYGSEPETPIPMSHVRFTLSTQIVLCTLHNVGGSATCGRIGGGSCGA